MGHYMTVMIEYSARCALSVLKSKYSVFFPWNNWTFIFKKKLGSRYFFYPQSCKFLVQPHSNPKKPAARIFLGYESGLKRGWVLSIEYCRAKPSFVTSCPCRAGGLHLREWWLTKIIRTFFLESQLPSSTCYVGMCVWMCARVYGTRVRVCAHMLHKCMLYTVYTRTYTIHHTYYPCLRVYIIHI